MAFSIAVYNGYGINKKERKMRDRYKKREAKRRKEIDKSKKEERYESEW